MITKEQRGCDSCVIVHLGNHRGSSQGSKGCRNRWEKCRNSPSICPPSLVLKMVCRGRLCKLVHQRWAVRGQAVRACLTPLSFHLNF